MKKGYLFKTSIFIFILTSLLGACSEEKGLSQDENLVGSVEEETTDLPEIKYVKEERQEFTNSDRKKDFEALDGSGKYSDAIKITDGLGNLVATEFGDYNLGISIKESDLGEAGVSAYVSYFDKDKKDLKDGDEIEFGPIWLEDPKVISNISFDKMDSESGDILLVSMSVISENDQYSSYYIYNKHMSLMDYISFSNSTSNISPAMTRGDRTTFPEGEDGEKGSLKEATEKRVVLEKSFLDEIDQTYGVEREEVFQSLGEDTTPVVYFPQDKGKVLKMLTIESLTDKKSYPADQGYFKIE